MQRYDGRLGRWDEFLKEAPAEARDEAILQLLELGRGFRTTRVSTDYLGFGHWPVATRDGKGAGHLLRPALVSDDLIIVFQVTVLTPRPYRMDGLALVLRPQRAFIDVEVDDPFHSPQLDAERAQAIGLTTLRIPGRGLIKGPSLTERLRAMGFCLPM
jgi:hypothetical protein